MTSPNRVKLLTEPRAGGLFRRHWGSGTIFPTTADGILPGDRFIHLTYASVTGSMTGAGANSWHGPCEFYWNGYAWNQVGVHRVAGVADRQAMTTAVLAAAASAACQPDAVGNGPHVGFLIYETTTGRLYSWSGTAWQLASDPNLGTAMNTLGAISPLVVAQTGWSLASGYMRQGPNGTAYVDCTFTLTGAAITVPADGNVANTLIAVLDAAWRPPDNITVRSNATGPLNAGHIQASTGNMYLDAIAPGASLATNATVQLASGYYPLANPMTLIGA